MATGGALLTAAEVAELLGLHRSSVTRMVKRGVLVPERKLPGRTGSFLFRAADIAALALLPA